MDTLELGQAFTITDRGFALLTGVFDDGEPFQFILDSFGKEYAFTQADFFSSRTTVTVTLVAPCLLGDCDQDGVVNFSDIPAFIAILQSGSFLKQADCNEDDVVDFSDIPAFIAILASN